MIARCGIGEGRIGALPVAGALQRGGKEEREPRRRHVPGGAIGHSSAVAAEGAPRHHRTRPRQLECLEAPHYHPATNQTEAAPEEHRSTAASSRNPNQRRGQCREQRGRWAELVAWRGRSGDGGPVEAGGGSGRNRNRRSAMRASPGATGARERGEKRMWSSVGSNQSSDQIDRVGPS
jgi:hypothetical protein